MPFKETKEGQTHFENDHCGEPEHNKPNLTKYVEIAIEKIIFKVLYVEFLHGVPVKLPSQTIELLRSSIREALKQYGDEREKKGREEIAEEVENIIKSMVGRFLGWKLPTDFSPDCGISFAKTYNNSTPTPSAFEPVGTNLFDAKQAEEMVRYMFDIPALKQYGD